MRPSRLVILASSFWLVAACTDDSRKRLPEATEFQESAYFTPTPAPNGAAASIGQVVYVPVYSHIYLSGLGKRDLAITLSIRNTDLDHSIIVRSVRYYDTNGQLLENYLDQSHTLAPLATAEVVIDQIDTRGGSGANFIVEWGADQVVTQPIIEAVMVGVTGTQGLSFSTHGQIIKNVDHQQ